MLDYLRTTLPGTAIVAAIHVRNVGDGPRQVDRVIAFADRELVGRRLGRHCHQRDSA
ncbi:MAG: hypothetical protein ACJ74U_15110 [Jatrophihabitantaceae bacterium]